MPGPYQRLQATVDAEPERGASVATGSADALSLASRLPLAHRTCAGPLPAALDARIVRAREGTDEATESLVFKERIAAYLFFGSAPFPDAPVAMLLHMNALSKAFSYTPFDTGGVLRGHIVPANPSGPCDPQQGVRDFLGLSDDFQDFAALYLSAHFRHPIDYVRSSQGGLPDFPPFHGYESAAESDRRAWTIELQARQPVPVTQDSVLEVIGMGKSDRDLYFPFPYVSAETRASEKDPVYVAVQRRILAVAGP